MKAIIQKERVGNGKRVTLHISTKIGLLTAVFVHGELAGFPTFKKGSFNRHATALPFDEEEVSDELVNELVAISKAQQNAEVMLRRHSPKL
jgi:hypothetical protein